jgi:hypothetical protein
LEVNVATHKPIAVLLVRSSDRSTPPEFKISDYEDFFLNDGESINQYWSDVSDGAIDLVGTRVFDWRNHGKTTEEFLRLSRLQKIQTAVNAFANSADPHQRVDLSPFDSVAVFADPAGEYGSVGRLPFDLQGRTHVLGTSLFNPAVMHRDLAHELGHGLGFDHSFSDSPVPIDPQNDGRPGAYGDLWDIMSADDVLSFGHERFGWMGPSLNTVMRDLAGWLTAARVIDWPGGAGTATIHEINDRAAGKKHVLKIAEFYFELRINRGWDRGIFRPSVQVRTRDFNVAEHSKLLRIPTMDIGRLQAARYEIDVGDGFTVGDPNSDAHRYIKVTVQTIDVVAGSATLAVESRPARTVPTAGPAIIFGGVEADGGGWIIVGNHGHRVPPHNPIATLLPGLGVLASAEQIEDRKLRRQIVESVASQSIARLQEITRRSTDCL